MIGVDFGIIHTLRSSGKRDSQNLFSIRFKYTILEKSSLISFTRPVVQRVGSRTGNGRTIHPPPKEKKLLLNSAAAYNLVLQSAVRVTFESQERTDTLSA